MNKSWRAPPICTIRRLCHGEQIDADEDAETITYRMNDGTTWIDGHQQEREAA
jgi:hypothetical protein